MKTFFYHFFTNGPHGLLTLANRKTKIDKYPKHITQQFEAMLLTLHFCNTIIHLENIYFAPMVPLEDLLSFIVMEIPSCPTSTKLIFTGYFTIDMLQNSVKQKRLLEFMQCKGILLLANKASTYAWIYFSKKCESLYNKFPIVHGFVYTMVN